MDMQQKKEQRLEWAKEHLGDFTNECSVQLEMHRRRACHRIGNPL